MKNRSIKKYRRKTGKKMPGEVIRKELCYKEEILININHLFKVFCRIFEECIWCVHYGVSASYKYRKTTPTFRDLEKYERDVTFFMHIFYIELLDQLTLQI